MSPQLRGRRIAPLPICPIRQHHSDIDAVLLDMMMPGVDGLQTLDELRKIAPEVTVIASSGLATTQREKEVRERGATAFLPKPYSDIQLLRTLAELLDRSSR